MSLAPQRLVALCAATHPVCPRCGRGVQGVPVSVQNGTVVCCRNRPARTEAGRVENHCGQYVAIVSAPGGLVFVLALSPQEARALSYGQPLQLIGAEIAACPSVP